jgi:hypothetical protein
VKKRRRREKAKATQPAGLARRKQRKGRRGGREEELRCSKSSAERRWRGDMKSGDVTSEEGAYVQDGTEHTRSSNTRSVLFLVSALRLRRARLLWRWRAEK